MTKEEWAEIDRRIDAWERHLARKAIADRNPSGGDVKQAPSRSDESGGAQSAIAKNPDNGPVIK